LARSFVQRELGLDGMSERRPVVADHGMSPYRHFRATPAGPVVILIEAGSPKVVRPMKPRFDPRPIRSKRQPTSFPRQQAEDMTAPEAFAKPRESGPWLKASVPRIAAVRTEPASGAHASRHAVSDRSHADEDQGRRPRKSLSTTQATARASVRTN
jgi:hypothetical protein